MFLRMFLRFLKGYAEPTCLCYQDYINGALSGVFGLSAIIAALPIAEVFIFYEDSHFSWGRSARIFSATLFAGSFVWTALAPIKSKNVEGSMDEETRNMYRIIHDSAAGATFVSLWVYVMAVTLDRCNPVEGRGCVAGNFLGLGFSTIGVVGLTVAQVRVPSPSKGPVCRLIVEILSN